MTLNQIPLIHLIASTASIAQVYLMQMRDITIQADKSRFRLNLQRFAHVAGFEISKTLRYDKIETTTPLGVADGYQLRDQLVLATIIRAGLPMHQGLLDVFDNAESAFITAYRQHHKDGTFEVRLEYVTCPDLDNKILIVTDPMLATGASMVRSLEALMEYGTPRAIHAVSVVASTTGLEYLQSRFPDVEIWIGAEDEELTAKSYIVPGLGDAGDLAYGEKWEDVD